MHRILPACCSARLSLPFCIPPTIPQAIVVFDIDGDKWTLDLRPDHGSLEKGEASEDAALTLTMNEATFINLVLGKTSPQTAFIMRKLKINGSMALAMKTQAILDAAAPKAKL
jgi:putative sterol carrier protein